MVQREQWGSAEGFRFAEPIAHCGVFGREGGGGLVTECRVWSPGLYRLPAKLAPIMHIASAWQAETVTPTVLWPVSRRIGFDTRIGGSR